MNAREIPFTQLELRELFIYDGSDLRWRMKTSTRDIVGDVAGTIHPNGYRRIKISGMPFYAHRVVWVYHKGYMSPEYQIDHINGKRLDNRIENLRVVNVQENQFNQKRARGYYFNKRIGAYVSQIKVADQRIYLGRFGSPEEAREAYLAAKQIYHIIQERN